MKRSLAQFSVLEELKKAKVQLEIAENNKGGHRMEATQLVNLTIEEVKKSISAGEKDSPMFKNIGECDEEIEITEAGRKLFARLGRKGGSRSSRKRLRRRYSTDGWEAIERCHIRF